MSPSPFYHVIFEARTGEWVRTVHGPLEFLHGARDEMAPIESVRRSVVTLPNVRLVEFDAGHDVIFTHEAALAAEIRSFLTSAE
jgi:pimeloyl-ACP methyl ester carboxylesterase